METLKLGSEARDLEIGTRRESPIISLLLTFLLPRRFRNSGLQDMRLRASLKMITSTLMLHRA